MTYPLTVFHFLVEWGGERMGFTEVTGLDAGTQVIEYREGSSPVYAPIKMPGLRKYSNVTLKRGILAGDGDFIQWVNTTALNQVERRDVLIKLLNEEHEPVVVWKLKNAWPVKLEGPTLNAATNEVAIETLELAHERLEMQNG